MFISYRNQYRLKKRLQHLSNCIRRGMCVVSTQKICAWGHLYRYKVYNNTSLSVVFCTYYFISIKCCLFLHCVFSKYIQYYVFWS